jgi:hypothetical protein
MLLLQTRILSVRRLLLILTFIISLSACQTPPSKSSQTLSGLTFDPWPWAPVQCFGCTWNDASHYQHDGKIARVEARKSGELVIVAAQNDAGGDIMPGFSISGVASENRFNIKFANSYSDANVRIKDNHNEKRTLAPGQHTLVTINNEEWMLYIVRASQWQDNGDKSKFLLDWVLLKTDRG